MSDHVTDHQARYHPTEAVEVLVAHTAKGRRTRVMAQRRIVDARLWGAMTEPQQEAAERLHQAYMIIAGAMMIRAPSWAQDRVDCMGQGTGEDRVWIERDFRDWLDACAKERVSTMPALRVIGLGKALIDGNNGSAREMSREHLFASLDVFVRMKGWR